MKKPLPKKANNLRKPRTYKKEIRSDGTVNCHKVTDDNKQKVQELASFGIPHENIARLLKICADTLVKHYKYELDIGTDEAVSKAAKTLFKKAVVDEDVTCLIFFLKTRGRWKTEDNKTLVDSNDEIKNQLRKLRDELDEKNRKEY